MTIKRWQELATITATFHAPAILDTPGPGAWLWINPAPNTLLIEFTIDSIPYGSLHSGYVRSLVGAELSMDGPHEVLIGDYPALATLVQALRQGGDPTVRVMVVYSCAAGQTASTPDSPAENITEYQIVGYIDPITCQYQPIGES